QEFMPGTRVSAYDNVPEVRERARERALAHIVCETAQEAVSDADLVLFCVPVGMMQAAARDIASTISPDALVSDVGSSKQTVTRDLRAALPDNVIIPAHPVAGTENSGPDAGFAHLFRHRWCILTPPVGTPAAPLAGLTGFWEAIGARVEIMDAAHHDRVLAVTSHIPHLIAYTIVGTASDLEEVTRSEVIKYSAGGFRDFTRIAASDPTMWRDVFLNNSEAVMEMLDQFLTDLAHMREAIRAGDGDSLYDLFTRTRAIRRGIIEMGQDDARPDFGRKDH
ncbi:MAG: prephenate/arogenate dehydrogenase family protein, partial [Sphingomonadaceae bacterium]